METRAQQEENSVRLARIIWRAARFLADLLEKEFGFGKKQ